MGHIGRLDHRGCEDADWTIRMCLWFRYHKVLKKAKRKEFLQEFEKMRESNPAAALEELKKMELARMQVGRHNPASGFTPANFQLGCNAEILR